MIFMLRVDCTTLQYAQSIFLAKTSNFELERVLIVYFSWFKMHMLRFLFPSWILKRILSPMGTQMGVQMVSKTVPRMGCESFSAICGRLDPPSKDFGANLDPLWPLWELIFDWFWVNSLLLTRQESIYYVPDYSDIAAVRKHSVPRQFGGHGGGTSAHAHWDTNSSRFH